MHDSKSLRWKWFLALPRPRWLYSRLQFWLRPARVNNIGQVQSVMAEYGLELLGKPQIPATVGRSRCLVVNTSRGKKLFKRYKKSMALSSIIHEHSILTRLAQFDFPAPRLVLTSKGETLVHQAGETFAISDFMAGYRQYNHYIVSPAQERRFIRMAGETLAMLHKKLERFVPEGKHHDGFKSPTGDRWRDLDWFIERLAYCKTKTVQGSVPDTISVLLHQGDWIQETLCQLHTELQAAAPLRLIIHGDYGLYNLLFKRNVSLIVLDFELARLDWRISDLAKAISNFAYSRYRGFSFEKMHVFLDAYRAHFPVSEAELLLVPAVWQFLLVRRLIVQWYNYCHHGTNRQVANIQRLFNWVDWINCNRNELLARLVSDR